MGANVMSNLMENGTLMLSVTPLDTSCEENSKEWDSESGYSVTPPSSVSTGLTRSSTPLSTQQACLLEAPPEVSSGARGRQANQKKLSVKDLFQSFLKNRKIMNSKHYDVVLTNSKYLQCLEDKMAPGSIESVKKNIFNQNMFLQPKPYSERIKVKDSDT